MRRGGLFFGVIVILLGLVLLALNIGIVSNMVWGLFWPALIVLLGLWFLLVPRGKTQKELKSEQISIPLAGASEAEIKLNYGAGQLRIDASGDSQELVGGNFAGGLRSDIQMEGSKAIVNLSTPSDVVFSGPWPTSEKGFAWNLGLNKTIPLSLHLHTGANEALVNLRELNVKTLSLETGASRTEITLPASAGMTKVNVKSGVSAVILHIPQGVAASIKATGGLSGIKVDTNRFIQSGDHYESADYASAANRVEIHSETGLGSVDID